MQREAFREKMKKITVFFILYSLLFSSAYSSCQRECNPFDCTSAWAGCAAKKEWLLNIPGTDPIHSTCYLNSGCGLVKNSANSRFFWECETQYHTCESPKSFPPGATPDICTSNTCACPSSHSYAGLNQIDNSVLGSAADYGIDQVCGAPSESGHVECCSNCSGYQSPSGSGHGDCGQFQQDVMNGLIGDQSNVCSDGQFMGTTAVAGTTGGDLNVPTSAFECKCGTASFQEDFHVPVPVMDASQSGLTYDNYCVHGKRSDFNECGENPFFEDGKLVCGDPGFGDNEPLPDGCVRDELTKRIVCDGEVHDDQQDGMNCINNEDTGKYTCLEDDLSETAQDCIFAEDGRIVCASKDNTDDDVLCVYNEDLHDYVCVRVNENVTDSIEKAQKDTECEGFYYVVDGKVHCSQKANKPDKDEGQLCKEDGKHYIADCEGKWICSSKPTIDCDGSKIDGEGGSENIELGDDGNPVSLDADDIAKGVRKGNKPLVDGVDDLNTSLDGIQDALDGMGDSLTASPSNTLGTFNGSDISADFFNHPEVIAAREQFVEQFGQIKADIHAFFNFELPETNATTACLIDESYKPFFLDETLEIRICLSDYPQVFNIIGLMILLVASIWSFMIILGK